jgi:hypothetical protein
VIVRGPRPSDHYAQIHNDLLEDERLSYRARGLAAYMLSRPPGWSTDSKTLAAHAREGRDAVRAALRELEQAGYLVRTKWQDDRGRFHNDQYISDQPQQTLPQVAP